ncbi:MAG TPA: YqgE/AlgH family protein [Salinivirga sp.]|uniref:YqgE/AlgH family protein n=1 Tax=Salinivirga sp. TaxID=1970192 RepID=UPI002B45C5A3|nr:YqgE/AlgH family protein [Salinivirga sp.]HKK58835.1 YqgE/AlgH family protein [Salinivirga sp.]
MYSKTNIFSFKEDPKKIKAGSVLVSEPFSRDPHFSKSVVLITEHNDKGTVGFILNKPVKMALSDLMKDFPNIDTNISIGGPVETNSVHFIHTLGQQIEGTKEVNDGLFWGGNFKKLQQLVSLGLVDQRHVKFFIGYAGWKPKQLETEIDNNYWKITNLQNTEILDNDPGMWYNTVAHFGEAFKPWLNVPENPAWN